MVDPRLFEAKLRALVRSRWGDAADRLETRSLPWGAAGFDPDTAWVLTEAHRVLGPALALARKESAREVHVMTDDADAAGVLARRAALFEPAPAVWRIEAVELVAAEPTPLPEYPALSEDVLEVGELIHLGGAEPIVEHGRLLGEVRGLEVCRVVDDASVGGEPVLQIGVGKYDREIHHEKHQGQPTRDALFGVVRSVLEHRVPGGEGNPAYHLATERWLRWALLRHPDLVGAARLEPVDSPVPRHDLRQPAPAPAAGVDTEGRPLLVVCGAGGDLDLVPAAADAWLADGRQPHLVLCVPPGDDHPVLHDLARLLRIDTTVVTAPANWREL